MSRPQRAGDNRSDFPAPSVARPTGKFTRGAKLGKNNKGGGDQAADAATPDVR